MFLIGPLYYLSCTLNCPKEFLNKYTFRVVVKTPKHQAELANIQFLVTGELRDKSQPQLGD